MMMFLYANGCSMTYGYELADDPVTHECLDHTYRETHAWPGRLAEHLGFQGMLNDSTPGGSNDRILRTTIAWVLGEWLQRGHSPTDLFVVIAWSNGMRREFFIDGEWRQMIPYHDSANPGLDRLTKVYREVAWNDTESAQRLATQIVALESFLRLHRIPYLFFDAIESIATACVHASRETAALLRSLDRRRYLGLDQLDGNMAAVVGEACPDWKGRHPAEEGHDFWARQLAERILRHDLLAISGAQPVAAVEAAAVRQGGWLTDLKRRLRRAGKGSRQTVGDPRPPFIYP